MNVRRKQNVLINKEVRELVRNSSIISRYKKLENILNKYERIYKTDFEDIPEFDDDLKNKVSSVFTEISMEAEKEWYRQKEENVTEGDERVKCALCNTNNKYIFYIKNRYNGKVLNVGSDCIDKFSYIDKNLPDGITLKQHKNRKIKTLKRIERIEQFNKKYPNSKKMISNWRYEYLGFPIIMPTDLHEDLTSNYEETNKLYEDYINEKISDSELYRFSELIEERKLKVDLSHKFINKNINKQFICTRNIYKWLDDNSMEPLIEKIRDNNSLIPNNELQNIYEEGFFKRMISKFKKMIIGTNLSFSDIENNRVYFIFKKRNKREGISMYMEIKKFMKIYGENLIKPQIKVKADSIMDNSILTNTEKNYEILEEHLQFILHDTKYIAKVNPYNIKELEIEDEEEKRYKDDLQTITFFNTHKTKILLEQPNYKLNIYRAIDNISSWRPLSDKEKFNIGDISEY